MGHAGVRHVQGRPPGHRHRPPGESRVPRERGAQRRRRLLPRHSRRHRLAHDDDQRPRHRGLGRRRHRGRGRHARPAGLFSHARRRRRPPHRCAARRRHRDGSRAHAHPDAAQGEGRRQICRVLRPWRRGAAGRRPRDDRQYGARIRRDHGLLPDRRRVHKFPARHRPRRKARRALRSLLQGPESLGHPAARHDRLLAGPRA